MAICVKFESISPDDVLVLFEHPASKNAHASAPAYCFLIVTLFLFIFNNYSTTNALFNNSAFTSIPKLVALV